jgi:hypothetical protein
MMGVTSPKYLGHLKTRDFRRNYVIKLANDKDLYSLMSNKGIDRVKKKFNSFKMTKNLLDKIEAQLARAKVKVQCQLLKGCSDIGLDLFGIHSLFEISLKTDTTLLSEDYARVIFNRIVPDLDSHAERGAWTSQTKGLLLPVSKTLC